MATVTNSETSTDRIRLLEALLDHSHDMIVVTDALGQVRWVNAAVHRTTGLTESDLVGHNVFEFIHPGEIEAVAASFATTVRSPGFRTPLDVRFRTASGDWMVCEVIGANHLDDPAIRGMVWHSRDVSHRYEMQRRHRRLFEESPVPTMLVRPGEQGIVANAAFADLTGYSVEELLYIDPYALLEPSQLSVVHGFFDAVVAGRRGPARGDVVVVRKDGSVFRAEVAAVTSVDDRGDITLITAMYDVTEWRDAVATNAATEARLAAIADHSSDIIVLIERSGYWTANAATERLLGYPKGLDLPEGPITLVHPDDRAIARAALAAALRGDWDEHTALELRLMHSDGEVRFYEFRARTTPAGDVVVTARDLTQQRQQTERLLDQERRIAREVAERERAEIDLRLEHAMRLESVGRLASGLAHDFNNLVGVILNYTAVLRRNPTLDQLGREDVAAIDVAAESASAMAHSLLQFGRVADEPVSEVDIRTVVHDLVPLVQGSLRGGQTCDVDVCDEAAVIRMNRGQVEQVVMNLALNARDALDDDGSIRIGVRVVPSGREGDRVVVVDVADNGTGMTDDVCKRAFDPFFTTKPTGTGTGLGLAVVHGIVHKHNGEVRLHSEVGSGTTVAVRIPAAPQEPAVV